MMLNRGAVALALVGGICLLLAGVTGLAAWGAIAQVVEEHITTDPTLMLVLGTLVAIASLGGLAVIAGGLLIGRGSVGSGKALIALGAGVGLIGFVLSLVLWLFGRGMMIGGGSLLGLLGIVLSIAARKIA
ncbi:MAG: hypothetical protein AB1665_05655 [Candidatus Thermoplasmatota archaeon]